MYSFPAVSGRGLIPQFVGSEVPEGAVTNVECQKSLRQVRRSKSGIELEERVDQRVQEVQELLKLGHVTLEGDQNRVEDNSDDDKSSPSKRSCIQNIGDDDVASPSKRRRRGNDSWKLIFEYADKVCAQMQQIDHEYWSISKAIASQVSMKCDQDAPSQRYVVPGKLFCSAEPLEHPAKMLTRAKQTLSKAPEAYTTALVDADPSSRFWPEVSQLKKDMEGLRQKINEAKQERCRTNDEIRELQTDLTKLEALR